MKSIRRRITDPLILGAILIPLLILLSFNIAMHLYMQRAARQDLKETAAVTRILIQQQLRADAADSGKTMLTRLDSIRALLRATSRYSGIDLMLVSRSGEITFPADPGLLGLSRVTLARLEQRLDRGLVAGRIEVIRTLGGQLFLLGAPVQESLPERSPWVVFLARYNPAQGIFLVTNLVLIAVLLAGSAASILMARRTAGRIGRSLQQLSHFAAQVGAHPVGETQPDPFCQEIAGLQQQFNQMAKRLEHADMMQKQFLQNASHELRTPLQAIQGYAEGLEKGVLQDIPAAAAIIGSESRRLNQLVESLLTLYRVDHQASHPDWQPLNLGNWLQDQLQRYRAIGTSMGKALQIGLDLPAQPDASVAAPVIPVDENLLNQAFANIMSNAVRYAHEKIRVALTTEPGTVAITVTDDGEGINPGDLPHLTERFFKGQDGHAGLGLAIADAAVRALHGTLTAANSPAGGAVFTIRLPVAGG